MSERGRGAAERGRRPMTHPGEGEFWSRHQRTNDERTNENGRTASSLGNDPPPRRGIHGWREITSLRGQEHA